MNNADKIIFDLCGGTGAWSKPYSEAGYDVRIITEPYNDVRNWKKDPDILQELCEHHRVYGILAAPPCTMFSSARTNAKKPRDLKGAMETVKACLEIIWAFSYQLPTPTSRKPKLKFWALENPYGMLKFFLGQPAMIFQPWEFGDNYKKQTALWGNFNIPQKNPIKCTKGKFDQTLMADFENKLPDGYKIPPGYNKRKCVRSMTHPGFAKAFFKANKG